MYIKFSNWLALPLSTRQKIATEFNIAKRGSTHVVDNKIQSDGYLVHEVENALTVEALQLYLGMMDEKDMNVLWERLVARIEGKEAPVVTPKAPAISILPPEQAKQFEKEYNQRKRKNAKTKN